MNKILTIFLLTLNLILSAQTSRILGTVTNMSNKDSIAFATVNIVEGKTFVATTKTNINGCFSVDKLNEGKYNLSFLSLTYIPLDIVVDLRKLDTVNLKIELVPDKSFDTLNFTIGVTADIAKQDIKNGNPKLMISNGIAVTIIQGQEIFEQKYKVTYGIYGCIGPSDNEMKNYNNEIFKYLDKTFGRKWRKEVRKDVAGL